MLKILTPDSGPDMQGYRLLGRGPMATGPDNGWRLTGFIFRCAQCGDCMPENTPSYFTCSCQSMCLDRDYHRFGSRLGDNNILVYRRADGLSQAVPAKI